MGMAEVLALPQQSPSQWGARKDYDSYTSQTKTHVTVHYTGGAKGYQAKIIQAGHARCDDTIRKIEYDHLYGNGWSSGIGYNFVICPHGTLFRARGAARGAHNPADSDNDGIADNVEAIGVLLLVGVDDVPTSKSLDMLQAVCDAMGSDKVWPHNAERPTSCPGKFLTAWSYNYYATTEEPDVPEDPEWKYPAHVENLKARGIYTKWTGPGYPIDTDNLSAYLDRTIKASSGLLRVEDKPTVYTLAGEYLIPVANPAQAKVHVLAMGGNPDNWGQYVQSITEAEFSEFKVLPSGALDNIGDGGLSKAEVTDIARKTADTRIAASKVTPPQ